MRNIYKIPLGKLSLQKKNKAKTSSRPYTSNIELACQGLKGESAVIECPICLVENEESAQFCRECGGRLIPKAAPSPLPVAVQELEHEAPPKPRRKLHSPILSGGFEEEEEPYRETEDTSPRPSPRSQSQNIKKGGLRSPLLGGGSQEYEYGLEPAPQSDYEYSQEPEEEIGQPRSRSGMRSPLLNGGGAKAAKSEFPHRQSGEAPKIERKSSGKLKSPLLDPGDFNPEEQFTEPNLQAKAGGLAKAHHHLRSPLLGGTDEDYYEEEEDYYEDEQPDPTALRSPLLAARSPRHERPAPANQALNNYAPASETPAQPSWPQPTAMQAPMQPAFEPQRAPSPSQSQFNLTAGSPNFTPANPYIPVGTAASGQAYPETAQAYAAPSPAMQTPVTAPSFPAPGPTIQAPAAPTFQTPASSPPSPLTDAEERRGGDGDRRANQRRGMGDRRLGSRLLGTAAPAEQEQPDDEDNDYPTFTRAGSPGVAASNNPAAPLLMAASAFALIVKAWGLSTLLGNPRLFSDYMPVFLDHVATIAVLFCLIIFCLNSTKK